MLCELIPCSAAPQLTSARPFSYLGFQGLGFERRRIKIVVITSRGHLLLTFPES